MSGILGGILSSLRRFSTLSFVSQATGVTNTIKRSVGYANFAGSPRWVMLTFGNSTTSTGNAYSHSTTGETGSWTTGTLPTTTTWGSMMTNADGTRMVIVSGYINQSGSVVAYSANGTSWTNANLPAAGSHQGKFLNGQYVLTNRNTSNNVLWSTTALTGSWTTATVASVNTLRGISYGVVDGVGAYVIMGNASTIYRSTNLTSWSAVTAPATGHVEVEFVNGVFVAVRQGSGTAYSYSINGGLTWTSGTFPATTGAITSQRLVTSERAGAFIMVFGNGTYSTSRDGINWTTPVSLATMTDGRVWDYAESPTIGLMLATSDGALTGQYWRTTL